MQKHLFESSATAVSIVVASCAFPNSSASSCDDDAKLCPPSSKAATSVTCDCQCTIGMSEETGESYQGRVPVCLPAELNLATASPQARVALNGLESQSFDQRVFRYCSQDVARFLRTTIKVPPGLRACPVPIHCECTTKGAHRDSKACHTDCGETACDARNCPGVLWRHGKLDASACFCSRASACGSLAPQSERPGVCRDWMTLASEPAPGKDAGPE